MRAPVFLALLTLVIAACATAAERGSSQRIVAPADTIGGFISSERS